MVAERNRQAIWQVGKGPLLAGVVPLMLVAGAASAQVVEPLPPVQTAPPPVAGQQPIPGFPDAVAPGGVVADPNRVFGDDAPDAGGFDILAGIGFDISAALRTEYNDNVARISDSRPLPERFESKGDWRITPMVSANLGRAIGRQRLFVAASLGKDFYARNDVLNRNRFQVDGGVQWTAGTRCAGRVQAGYNERGTRLSDFEEVLPSTQRTSSFLVNGGCSLATGLGFNGGYSWSSLENSIAAREYADTRSSGFNGSLFYRLGQRADISVQGSTRQVRYPNQLLPDASENGLKLSSLMLAVGYRLGPSIRLNGGIGQSWVDPRNPLASTFSGNTWNVGAIYSGPRLGANLSAGRDVSTGSSGYTGYQVSDTIQAAVSYRFGDRIGTSAGYAHRNQRNRGAGGFGGTSIDSFTQDRLFVGADYRINRIFSSGLDFSHQKRSSNPAGFDYSANSILLTLRARI